VADERKPPAAFVPLKALTRPAEPAAALAEIRQIYFKTSKQTIEHDFAHAIELLKGLPDEETRARAHVYMEGLAEMRNGWMKDRSKVEGRRSKVEGQRSKVKGQRSKVEGRRSKVSGDE
jgi:hypothetical protein